MSETYMVKLYDELLNTINSLLADYSLPYLLLQQRLRLGQDDLLDDQ